MAVKAKSGAVWSELNVESLETAQLQLYSDYKDLYKEMKAAREEFETAMQVHAPEGKRLIFGYNFGKLSVAIVEATDKPKAKGAVDLSTLIRRG